MNSETPIGPPNSPPSNSKHFERVADWYEHRAEQWDVLGDGAFQSLADEFAEVEQEALVAAADVCRTYAHSGQNVYSRNVAYACERRIRALISQRASATRP